MEDNATPPNNTATIPSNTAAASNSPAGSSGNPGEDFSKSIPAEYQGREYLKDIKDLPSLFKKLDNAQSLLGKRPAGIPQENAPESEWQAFNKAFGVPEKADEYEFSPVPDGAKTDAEFQKVAKNIFIKAGLSKKQASAVQKEWDAYAVEQGKLVESKKVEQDKAFEEITSKIFGDRKEAVLKNSRVLIEKYMPAELKPHLDSLTNEQLTIMAGALDNIRKQFISEDTLPDSGSAQPGASTPEQIREEARKLMASEAYTNAWHAEHKSTQEKISKLYERLKSIKGA